MGSEITRRVAFGAQQAPKVERAKQGAPRVARQAFAIGGRKRGNTMCHFNGKPESFLGRRRHPGHGRTWCCSLSRPRTAGLLAVSRDVSKAHSRSGERLRPWWRLRADDV